MRWMICSEGQWVQVTLDVYLSWPKDQRRVINSPEHREEMKRKKLKRRVAAEAGESYHDPEADWQTR